VLSRTLLLFSPSNYDLQTLTWRAYGPTRPQPSASTMPKATLVRLRTSITLSIAIAIACRDNRPSGVILSNFDPFAVRRDLRKKRTFYLGARLDPTISIEII
jgi:hypothetical protein